MWLEDPIPPDARALSRIQSSTTVPIATGENTYLVEGFRPLIDAGAVTIVTPDAQKCGGLFETKRIFEDAALAFIQGAPHCVAGPLGLTASAHVCATVTNAACLEFHGSDVPFWHDLVDRQVIVDGHALVSEAPGLGVELNEETVRRYSSHGVSAFAHAPA
jgi:L-alanine-DL-glutamate epimerase-like enolase superfamily enzyme